METIRAILEACPQSAAARDSTGRLPLHLAIEASSAPESLCALVEAHPAAAAERDPKRGNAFPLALYMGGGGGRGDRAVVQALIRGHPQAVLEADKGGRSLMHHIVAKTVGLAVGDKVRLSVTYKFVDGANEGCLSTRDEGEIDKLDTDDRRAAAQHHTRGASARVTTLAAEAFRNEPPRP